ncbi:MAG TPA: hypothetical protein VM618_04420, partial [Acidimicrobiia bacterium]|nr:hypothetical protein [Acidimicrobiia bacterium]
MSQVGTTGPRPTRRRESPLQRPPAERGRIVEQVADALDAPMTALGVIFLLVVLAETVMNPTGGVATAFVVAGWALWAVFVAEFVFRLVVAPDTVAFLRRNWWQIVFLVLPFLRFARVLARLRV